MAAPSPRAIVATVRTFARRHDLLRPGPLVLAVSGGADSTALALVLSELRDEFGLTLHVAHFDHRTRPKDAPKDAAFAAALADRIGAPIRVGRADRAPASEDDARRARYTFLRRVASETGATAIATGHTRDDQAETVLLHLTRGAGLAGAAGMRPLRDGIVRPLLPIGRAETRALCAAARIRPRTDPTNRSLRFARNRMRLRVLPELERINPQVRAALARFGEAAAEAEDLLERVAPTRGPEPESAPDRAAAGAGAVRLTRVIELASLPEEPASRERRLAALWRETTGRSLDARQRHALAALASSTEGTSRIDLPGGPAVREYGRLRLAVGRDDTAAPVAGPAPLRAGRAVEWHGWRIALGMGGDGRALTGSVPAGSAERLAVRSRRPGDRVRPGKKLQDVFVDAKVPVRLRDTWPVITLDDDVVWVPGLTPPPTDGGVLLAAERVGNDTTTGEDFTGGFRGVRQVASKTEARRRGGKRGRP